MALGNTPLAETTISVEASKSYTFGLWFKAGDGSVVDLQGSEVRFVATSGPTRRGSEVLSLVGVPVLGQPDMVQFQFQAADLALAPNPYAYDVTLVTPTGYSVPILKGLLEVGANSDEDISNSYSDVSTSADVIVTLVGNDVVQVTVERVDGLFNLVKELLEDFQMKLAAAEANLQQQVVAAGASASNAANSADELRGWMASVGFPFWKGTQAQYDALATKDPNVLYLIIA